MTVNELVYQTVDGVPEGLTSSEICNLHPEIPRGTITSAVAKLKKRGQLIGITDAGNNPPQLFSTRNYMGRLSTPESCRLVLLDISTPPPEVIEFDRIISVLAPFANFAEEMLKNKAWGHLHVWLSGSTEPPTISLGEGLWFLEALDLYKELKKLTKK